MTMNAPEPELTDEPLARTAWTAVGTMPVTPAADTAAPVEPPAPLVPAPLVPPQSTGPVDAEDTPEEEKDSDGGGVITPDNWHQP